MRAVLVGGPLEGSEIEVRDCVKARLDIVMPDGLFAVLRYVYSMRATVEHGRPAMVYNGTDHEDIDPSRN